MSEAQAALNVVVIGASGAVGKDLLAAMDKVAFPVGRVLGVVSRRSAELELSARGAPIEVITLDNRRAFVGALSTADLVFCATPAALTRELAPLVVEQGPALIDIGAALFDQSAPFLPGLGMDLARFDHLRVASTPCAPVAALATLLSPLRALGLSHARGTMMLSAGLYGRAALDELSAQVVALFGGGSPPRKVFPGGLAFDLVDPPGDEEGGEDWSAPERTLAEQTAALVQLERSAVGVTITMAPIFAGLALSLHLRVSEGTRPDELLRALEAAEGVRVGDPVPSPRRLPGRSGLYVGRLRADPAGDGYHVWATADNLRFGATAPAVGAATTLWREGRLTRD